MVNEEIQMDMKNAYYSLNVNRLKIRGLNQEFRNLISFLSWTNKFKSHVTTFHERIQSAALLAEDNWPPLPKVHCCARKCSKRL